MSISRWKQYSSSLSVIVTGNNTQLGSYNEGANETTHGISFSLIKQPIYAGLSSVRLSSSGSYNVGSVRGGAQITITVSWQTTTPPVSQTVGNPTTVTLSKNVTSPSSTATLSWSNATGLSQYISGYQIQRKTGDGSYAIIKEVNTPGVFSGSETVTASATNGETYIFNVYTVPASGATNPGTSYSTPSLLATQAFAPTSIVVSTSTPSPSGNFTLSWSGAKGSASNAISGYDVYRSATQSGPYSKISTINTTASSASALMSAPSMNGATYYYKVATKGSAAPECASPLSTAYAGVTATKKSVFAPTVVGISSQKAYPGATLCLYWSGANAGDSSIVGYAIYRDISATGTFASLLAQVDSTDTFGNLFVTAPVAVGTTYYYKIQTLSADIGYESDLSTAMASVQTQTQQPILFAVGTTNASGWY